MTYVNSYKFRPRGVFLRESLQPRYTLFFIRIIKILNMHFKILIILLQTNGTYIVACWLIHLCFDYLSMAYLAATCRN